MKYKADNLVLDTELHELLRDGEAVDVEPLVFDLLIYLVENQERVVTRGELLDEVWKGRVVSDSALSAALKTARKAVGDSGRKQSVIKTIHGLGYKFLPPASKADQASNSAKQSKDNLPSGPSIAVLPFNNTTNRPEQDYFAYGVSASIVSELSRYTSLIVKFADWPENLRERPVTITRDLNVRYLLRGRVSRTGSHVRVTVEMIDGEENATIWSEQFDRQGDDAIAIQDEISQKIATMLWSYRGKIRHADLQRLARKPASRFDAYDFVLRGINHKDLFTREDNEVAMESFRLAIEIDSHYAEAYSWLAWVYGMEFEMGWTADANASLSSALAAARQALKLDRYCAVGLSGLGYIQRLYGQFDESVATYDRLTKLYPHYADGLALRADSLTLAGRADEAVREVHRAIELNPYHPDWYWWALGLACYGAGKYEDAINALSRMPHHNESTLICLAACYAQLGELTAANIKIRELLTLAPEASIANLRLVFKDSVVQDSLHQSLRDAGLPE